jgi:hypothetical protein
MEEYHDAHHIRILYGRQSVSDGNGGSSLGGLVERSLHHLLGVGIKCRGSLESMPMRSLPAEAYLARR